MFYAVNLSYGPVVYLASLSGLFRRKVKLLLSPWCCLHCCGGTTKFNIGRIFLLFVYRFHSYLHTMSPRTAFFQWLFTLGLFQLLITLWPWPSSDLDILSLLDKTFSISWQILSILTLFPRTISFMQPSTGTCSAVLLLQFVMKPLWWHHIMLAMLKVQPLETAAYLWLAHVTITSNNKN